MISRTNFFCLAQHFLAITLDPDFIHIESQTTGQIIHRFFMCPFLQQFSDPQQKHGGAGGGHITTQHRHTDGGGIQYRHFDLPLHQTPDPLVNIADGFPCSINISYRYRQKYFAHEPHDHFSYQFFSVTCIQFSAGIIKDLLRHFHPVISEGFYPFHHIFPAALIVYDRIGRPFIYFCSSHLILCLQII